MGASIHCWLPLVSSCPAEPCSVIEGLLLGDILPSGVPEVQLVSRNLKPQLPFTLGL